MGQGPPARGQRIAWADLPAELRATVERRLGAAVTAAVSQPGGFSPGLAARLLTADGQRLFLKALAPWPNPQAPALHRREARIAAALPLGVPVPRLLWTHDEGEDGWVVLAFEDVEGRQPALPWRADELERVLAAMTTLAASLTPAPAALAGLEAIESWPLLRRRWWAELAASPPVGLDAWSRRHAAAAHRLAEGAPALARGSTLLHLDIRADNLLLSNERVLVVDWPHARIGAAWVDAIFFAPSLAMQGGPEPEALLRRYEPARAAEATAVSAVVAVMAGFFTFEALQPPPPGLPTLRPFQAAQGEVARRWLAERTGWT